VTRPTAAITVRGVAGLPEIAPGDDVAALIAAAEPGLRDGDVIAVSSKIVSKAEGRLVPGDRDPAVTAETARIVATRGDTRIVATRHGFVVAAAGVDASNVPAGQVLLLPADPDASARRIRSGLAERLGVDVGVIVTDTFGRPWRLGLTDVALGVAGLPPLVDERGRLDRYGRRLDVTVTAVADELAGAADLVKGKLAGVPVAVITGWPAVGGADGPGGAALVRPVEEDLFPLGSLEARRSAVGDRRESRRFAPGGTVDPDALRLALAAVAAARVGTGAAGWRLAAAADEERTRVLAALAPEDGEVARGAPLLVTVEAADRTAGTLLGTGAAVGHLVVALHAEGYASCWLPAVAAGGLCGVVAVGRPAPA
jgi:coenzyme F420-0:L-glutamate ligase/coenzyme F420-1:gamma-L-glutamate ligase